MFSAVQQVREENPVASGSAEPAEDNVKADEDMARKSKEMQGKKVQPDILLHHKILFVLSKFLYFHFLNVYKFCKKCNQIFCSMTKVLSNKKT